MSSSETTKEETTTTKEEQQTKPRSLSDDSSQDSDNEGDVHNAGATVVDAETMLALSQTAKGMVTLNTDQSQDGIRRRRLTFATQKSHIRDEGSKNHDDDVGIDHIFRSYEIGAIPKEEPPFPVNIVGTYSCHGIEPSYLDSTPYVAKTNQDRGCVVYPFNSNAKEALFAVFDGHGESGDKVSEFIMNELPTILEDDPNIAEDDTIPNALKAAFLNTDDRLAKNHSIESLYSGSTAVVAYLKDNKIWVANAGDSRCTMATRNNDGKLVAKDFSIDQNPDSPEEQARILKAGGFVSPPPEEGLSARVWLDPDFTQVGLAMGRSIGDHVVKQVGVIAEPVVKYFEIDIEVDQFMILASDGVWEFISSDEAITIVDQYRTKEGYAFACQMLIETAADRWRAIEGDYRDDITAMVVQMLPF